MKSLLKPHFFLWNQLSPCILESARAFAFRTAAMFVLCTEPALPNLRRIGPQDHFGTNLEPSRLDPIVKVIRKLFRGFHFTVTVRITDRGLFVRGRVSST